MDRSAEQMASMPVHEKMLRLEASMLALQLATIKSDAEGPTQEVVTLLKSAMAGLYGSWESAQAFAQDWQNGLASQLMQASSSPLRS
jgi:hypothetical protein